MRRDHSGILVALIEFGSSDPSDLGREVELETLHQCSRPEAYLQLGFLYWELAYWEFGIGNLIPHHSAAAAL